MQVYSVWNGKEYDYYEAADIVAPTPSHLESSKIGTPADDAGWPLPKNAIKVGSGPQARGMVASTSSSSSISITTIVAIGVLAWVLLDR
jgi:hypothetical protein